MRSIKYIKKNQGVRSINDLYSHYGSKRRRQRPPVQTPGCPIRQALPLQRERKKKDIICIFLSFFNKEINIFASSLGTRELVYLLRWFKSI